jgi:peptidoglycan/xylan/chitin deacetylase (PgdA/CDA1 family)
MPLWKQLLLTLYYHASYPLRERHGRQESADAHMPLIVLYYHRVADDCATPWTISNAMFLRQMQWLQKRFTFISLEETQSRIRSGRNAQPCISITFDDGYADNCRQAIPWLIKERIPCTYFVTLHNVFKGEPFSHDLVMGHRLPPNTLEQIRAMAAAGIEIGCHSYTHANLGPLSDARLLRYEIADAKETLESALGRPVRYFAFPFGYYANLNAGGFHLAEATGYAGVCSAYGGFNFPGDDAFHLQRIPADGAMIHLKNWVTMDPRKLHTPRFQYRDVATVMPEPDAEEAYFEAEELFLEMKKSAKIKESKSRAK